MTTNGFDGPNTGHSICRVLASLLIITHALVAPGCNVNPAPDGGTPPDIPPASTFVMDFSDFQDGNDAGKTIAEVDATHAQLIDPTNWQWAAGHVVVWNVILTVTLAIPVAAYFESFNHAPQFDPATGTWTWEYEFNAVGARHTASLQGTIVGATVEWDMFISKEGEFSNVNWYSGVSRFDGTSGSWRLNRDPQNVTPFIDIAWTRDVDAGTSDIRYTNVVPEGPENGGFIYFGILIGGEGRDRVYQIFNKGEDNLLDIEWNSMTKDGRVQDEAHFGDTDWHCWDTMLVDATCEEDATE